MSKNKKSGGKKEETLVYKPHIIIVKGMTERGEEIEIMFTPERFKEWIYKIIEQGLNNVAIFKGIKRK